MSTNSLSPRRSIVLTFLSLVVAILAGIGTAGSASAYTPSGNVPVRPTIYQVQGMHYNAGTAITGNMWKQRVYQDGPVAQRTQPSGAQYVRITYTVSKWNGSTSRWESQATYTGNATIPATQVSVKMPYLSHIQASTGYYAVNVALVWTNQIGAVVGSFNANMNQQGDYTCSTTRICSAGPGYVYLG